MLLHFFFNLVFYKHRSQLYLLPFVCVDKMKFISVSRLYFFCIIFGLCQKCIISNNSEGDKWEDYGSIFSSLNEHSKSNLNYEDPKIDFLKEDDAGEFELGDIISLSRANVETSIDAYNTLEILTFVDIHNIYRSNLTKPIPKGSDVMYVEWNNTLALAAGEWLKECQLKQGFGVNDTVTKLRGQNMYQGSSRHPSRPIYLWYQEYKDYFFHNFSCKQPYPKYQCGHMTQLLWSDSALIGCARRSYCFPHNPRDKLVNCYYYRRGNLAIPGMQVFKYGWQCTRCDIAGGSLCYNNLCVSKKLCKNYKMDCECKLNCKNCVKPNYKTCRCEPCKDGWDWPDCSHPCYNAFDILKYKQGFCRWQVKVMTEKACESNKDILTACRKDCKACKPLNFTSAKEGDLCCDGKKCPPYHVLDKNCNCTMDCPSNLCLYPPSTTTENPQVLKNPTSGKKVPKRKEVKISSGSISRTESALVNLILLVLSTFILRDIPIIPVTFEGSLELQTLDGV